MRILCDIGGTHIRAGLLQDGKILSPQKFEVAGFASVEAALLHYLAETGLAAEPCSVAISCAANNDGNGIYHFGNNPHLVIDPAAMNDHGWRLECTVNDFSASAWGVAALDEQGLQTIRAGREDETEMLPRAILGPGTGLGLAYILPLATGGVHVQLNHGGHMLAPVLSDEPFLLAELVRRNKGDGHTVIPENFCSGRGLPLLYNAVCDAYGYDPVHTTPANMLDNPQDPAVRETLRLFHEFLGLFAHLVVVTGNAYGGLYLDGGVLHHLRTRHLFDADTFLGFMTLNPVASVKRSLDQCPVHLVLDPYIALRGLQVMMEQDS